SALSSIAVDLKSGNDELSLDPTFTAALVPLTYKASATGSLRSLAGPDDPLDSWKVSGKDSGTLDGVISFSKIGQVFGGDNPSTFTIQPFSGGGSLTLTGGDGSSTLDYSAFTTAVKVDLSTGTTTNLGFVTGIENVTGGSGADTITGDDQNNILSGGPG